MKVRLLVLTLLSFVTATLLAFSFNKTSSSSATTITKKKNIVKCGPDWEALQSWLDEANIPPVPGSGKHTWKISTRNDSAQFYFNQGINMYYCFHIIESMASFKKAEKFDPGSAMIQWAQALAYGPNINDIGYAASPEALKATRKAVELSATASAKEKMLIDAMVVRYSTDSTESRVKLNQQYVDKMKLAYEQYKTDADITALYADALMLQHPWDLWNNDGTPKEWTPVIWDLLKKLVAKAPDHPGAHHYYIHLMEPSPYAYQALPSAAILSKLTPGLSHTVHMPSHIYLRTGNYIEGGTLNEQAVKAYRKVFALYPAAAGNDFLYVIHNLHMQANQGMMAGRIAYSVNAAAETVNNIPKDYLTFPGALGNYVQYIYMVPMLVNVRFGMWEEALERSQPEQGMVYANVIHHFGRGMAFAGQSKLNDAKKELSLIQELMKDSTLYLPFPPFSPSIEGTKVAYNLLSGTILLKEKKYAPAIEAFSLAVTTEENMVYDEPRDWLLNPKHYLGKAYLVAAQWADAEKTFKKDLEINNDNVWALKGLHQALIGQLKTKEAGKLLSRLNAAAKNADLKVITPAF